MRDIIRTSGLLTFLLAMLMINLSAQITSGRLPDIRDVFNGRSSKDWAIEQQANGFHVPSGQMSLEAQLEQWRSVSKTKQVLIFQGTSMMRKPEEAILVAESDAWQHAVSILPKPQKTQPGFLIMQLDTTICADRLGNVVLLSKQNGKTQCVFFVLLTENDKREDCPSPVHLTMNSTTLAGGESLFDTMTQTIINFSGNTRTLLEQSYFHYLSPNDEAILMHGQLWEIRDAWSKPRSIHLKR